MGLNFVEIDDNTLRRVSLAHKVVYVISLITNILITLFPAGISIFGSPNVMNNNIFKLDAYLGRKVTTFEKLLFNFTLYIPFIIQHSIMARTWFKEAMQMRWRNFVFYERILFNLFSFITVWFIFVFFQSDDYIIFTVDFPFATAIWIMLYAFGFFMSSWAVGDMGDNDLYGIGRLKDFKTKKGSKFPAYVEGETNSVLRASCRHPLYFSMFIYNIFGPTVYTATRLGHIVTTITHMSILERLSRRENSERFLDILTI